MSLCDSCKYQYYVEQLKPCIILRDDCKFYEYDGISKEEHYESCDACGHLNETDGGNCYECVKSMKDNCDSQKSNMEDIAKAFQFGFTLGFGESHDEIDKIIDEIKKIITPQSKTGHWIIYDVHGHKACKCSECDKDVGYPCNYKYCPYCGHFMIKPQESAEWLPQYEGKWVTESEDKCKNCEHYINPDYTRCHECKTEREDNE